MMIVGFLGAMFPVAASLTTVVFVAWLLLFSGFLVGFSLFFDGLALLMGANLFKKLTDEK